MILLRLIFRYLRPHWTLIVGVVIFQSVQTIAALYLPKLTADIIDHGVARGDTAYVLRVGGVMLALSFGQITAAIVAVYLASKLSMKFGRDSRAAVFDRVGDYSAREVGKFGTPSLVTRTTNDVQQVQNLVQMSATLLIGAPIMAVGGILMATSLDLKLSTVIAISVPVLLIGVVVIISRMMPLFRRQQRLVDAVNRVLREQLTGIRVLRAFVREPYEEKRFDTTNEDLTHTATSAGRLFAVMFPFVLLVLNLSSVAVIWFGAFRVNDGLQVGVLFAFLSYIVQILMSIMMTTFLMAMVPRASVSAERITQVLATEPSVRQSARPESSPRGPATLMFDDVSFCYPNAEEPVLRNISFTIRPGTTTAVIGATGSGKTTLVNLVARLMDVTSGAVRLDGADVRDLDSESLWARIGLVPQSPLLFTGTVASNLRYGNAAASDDGLRKALSIAQASGFVDEMPDGLDAPITQGGTNVSGGQRQRLAIARALTKNADLYVFDDAFSALDTRTDALLRSALSRELPQATKLIVAQRVATITGADQIIVLEAGTIAAIGTHAELLESSATYAEIVSSQLAASEGLS